MAPTSQKRADDPRTDRTRRRLIAAGIKLFSRSGFDKTTVRDVADEAGANVAAIKYHFGSKEGLHWATIEAVAEDLRDRKIGHVLRTALPDDLGAITPQEAKAILRDVMVKSLEDAVSDPQGAHYSAFIQREILQPGPAAAHFVDTVFRHNVSLTAQLVAAATGLPADAPETRLKALMIVGQSVFMNMARPVVELIMGWEGYDAAAYERIKAAFWVDFEDVPGAEA